MMRSLTPLVEPLSIDEAFLDLAGTAELHHGSPARSLARLALEVERRIGVTVSIGLSYNKSLAKIASDLDKPRGFALIGRGEAVDFLGPKPVGLIWGVGKALQARLAGDGIATIADLRGAQEIELVARYGSIGRRLYRFARGEDDRRVDPDGEMKSISAETTFDEDIAQRRASGGRALAALREGLPADEALWPAGPEHPPQAQDLGFQDPDPLAPAARGDPARRGALPGGPAAAEGRMHGPALPADRRRRRRSRAGERGGPAGSAGRRRSAPGRGRAGDGCAARQAGRGCHPQGPRACGQPHAASPAPTAPSLSSQAPGAPPASSKPRRP